MSPTESPSLLLSAALAPLFTRKVTLSLSPRESEPCSAVYPLLSNAFTSLPSSTQYFTASSAVYGERTLQFHAQPMPAAACSGVYPAFVASLGSAPCATRKRMATMSLDWAARQNAVAPAGSTHV